MNASGGSSALRNFDPGNPESQVSSSPSQQKPAVEKLLSLSELRDLVAAKEDRVRKILSSGKDLHLCADELLLELRRLVSKETARLDLAEGLSQFAHRFHAEPTAVSVMADLVNSLERLSREGAEGTLKMGARRTAQYRTEIAELFSEFFRWYSARIQSFAALENERALALQSGKMTEAEAVKDGAKEQIFNITIIHDQLVEGMRGMVVEFGVKISRARGERYWSRISVREPGKDVVCRSGWESWTDLSQIKNDGPPKFASIIPIFARQQRFVLDRVRHFIPYDALELPEGELRCEIRITLFNDQHENVASVKQYRFVPISPQAKLSVAVQSPQSREFWSRDPISGTRVSELRIARRDLAGDLLSVVINFDLEIYQGDQNLGAGYLAELRLRDSSGREVSSRDPRLADDHQKFSASFEVLPSRVIQRFFHREFEIPLSALELSVGGHELTAVLSIYGANDELLCGNTLRFAVEIPPSIVHSIDALSIQRLKNEGVFTSPR